MDGKHNYICVLQSDAKRGRQGYFSFLGTATLSEATKPAVVAEYISGCHIETTNKYAAGGHETATIISSFSEWLLWVIVFTNIAIDIVTNITNAIGSEMWHGEQS